MKPAAQTPLTALTALLEEVGLPPGVLDVVPTSQAEELIPPLMDGERLPEVSFTGSTREGSRGSRSTSASRTPAWAAPRALSPRPTC